MKTIMFMIMLAMIGLVSAQTITIEPSTFNMSAFPGETLQKNITIKTDGNYAVYLSYLVYDNSSEVNLSLNYQSPLVVEKNITIPINFTFSSSFIPQTFKLKLTVETQYAETIIPPPEEAQQQSSGGGGGYYSPTKKNETKQNETKMQEQKKDEIVKNETEQKEKIDEIKEKPKISIGRKILNWFKNLFRRIFNN